METLIRLQNINKSYSGKAEDSILRNLNLTIRRGEFLSLIGPSGAGKTTLLKIMAGFISPDSGQIYTDESLRQRPPVLVFQDYQLFPYMTVFQNIAFGLKAGKYGRGSGGTGKMSRKEISSETEDMAGFFGLEDKLKSYPGQLSGGEKQRCALARAAVLKPDLLLLDEPFANLDKNLKSRTARYLSTMQKELGLSVLSVTHDQEEAMAFSDRIGILLEGQLKEWGTAEEVYSSPRTLEGALFTGTVNTIPDELQTYFGISVSSAAYARGESLELHPAPGGAGIIRSRHFSGGRNTYEVELSSFTFSVHAGDIQAFPGDRVDLILKDFFLLSGEPDINRKSIGA